MQPAGLVTLTMRELDRLKVIQAVVDMGLKPGRAAERLGLSVRQVERLVIRYREHGPGGVASGRRGRPGNRKLDDGLALRALTIIRERYADFGPTLACEKLWECHGIRLAKETVRKLMTDAGLWIPRRQRPPKVYQPRARRACLGELIQIDGCDHRWFEERAPACTLLGTLLVYVDDLTLQDRLVKEMRLRGDPHGCRRQRLCALLHGRLQRTLREAAEERCCTSRAWRVGAQPTMESISPAAAANLNPPARTLESDRKRRGSSPLSWPCAWPLLPDARA